MKRPAGIRPKNDDGETEVLPVGEGRRTLHCLEQSGSGLAGAGSTSTETAIRAATTSVSDINAQSLTSG
jgi:hypothetical protein